MSASTPDNKQSLTAKSLNIATLPSDTSALSFRNLLSGKQVEIESGGAIKEKTLAHNRSTGRGVQLPYVKIHKRIYYRREDVQEYLAAAYSGAASA